MVEFINYCVLPSIVPALALTDCDGRRVCSICSATSGWAAYRKEKLGEIGFVCI